MKKLLLIVLCFPLLTLAQQTYVPDDNFEAYLEANGMGNGIANDDSVTTSNINTITSLDVSSKAIIDLTGIEDFSALTNLNCHNNQLTSLDVSQITALYKLDCGANQLTSLDVSQITALYNLDCSVNHLTSLDLSQNSALTYLFCENNQLTNLDLSQNTALTEVFFTNNQLTSLDLSQNTTLEYFGCNNNQLTSLDFRNGNNQNLSIFNVTNNSNLTCINVDDVTYSDTNWTNIDAQHYFSTNCPPPLPPQTYVPDDNFEAYLEANGMGDGIANNDSVTTSNINTITSLDVSSKAIIDLTGIEDFSALTNLDCSSNQLTILNISQNTSLTALDCPSNQLTSLNLSSNTVLTSLYCGFNQLNTLDVSQNTALNVLYCGFNQLTSLDLSQNTALTVLNCSSNQLTSLDFRNGNNQNLLNFNVTSNPNLTCINVDDVTYSNNNWTNIDAQHYFSTNCPPPLSPQTYVPDDNFEAYLEANNMGNGIANDDSVTTSNIVGITSLNVSSKAISDLTGIEDFASLSSLYCNDNQLTSLDVSQNTALTDLRCGKNSLTSLDVSQNTALTVLACGINQLTSLDLSQNTALTVLNGETNQLTTLDLSQNTALTFLSCSYNSLTNLDVSNNTALTALVCNNNQLNNLDVSNNTALTELYCSYNQLNSLDVRNGNNQNILTFNFNVSSNPNLTCINVDDVNYSTNNWLLIDAQHYFSTNCSSPNSVQEIPHSISLYPNPTNENITISINNFTENIQTEVYDLIGNRLQISNETTISLQDYAIGIYLLKVAYGDRVEEVKVIKQ